MFLVCLRLKILIGTNCSAINTTSPCVKSAMMTCSDLILLSPYQTLRAQSLGQSLLTVREIPLSEISSHKELFCSQLWLENEQPHTSSCQHPTGDTVTVTVTVNGHGHGHGHGVLFY
jgi:hypothetical protein